MKGNTIRLVNSSYLETIAELARWLSGEGTCHRN